tara:strand:+ start:355 stop:1080 length:726 start_codon:yes stop_codon:yes gene_type:complete
MENDKNDKNDKNGNIYIIILISLPLILYILLNNNITKNLLFNFIKNISLLKGSNHGKLLFVIFVILMNIIFFHNTISNIISGYIFGLRDGLILTMIGNIISGIFSFYVSKYYINKRILRFINKSYYLKDFKNIIVKERNISDYEWFKLVVFSRLSPMYSFQIISYYWGVTDVPLYIFILGSIIGSLPISIFDTYIGSKLNNIRHLFKHDIKSIIVMFVFVMILIIISSHKIHNIIEHISSN